ncbi:ATP-binding protein [Halomonas sp. ISL-60]|uniref:AAA family ATPase n=1 Tax=Halomonas sp. ISL-56 TaxID=2819149 RepID=UPI001BE7F516|nr:ATP-binding protein [Halomonas sp. ISL-56]MBT2775195.1 ATP-binding protein [Halomonas sp. ISL-60]MBT2803546.1 ATP-binding protein [Halomonas sp. ISL-56]
MNHYGTLLFFCGKMGAGKSTLSAKVAQQRGAVLISEDAWLEALYPGEIENFNDYLNYSSRLKPILREHVKQVLMTGASVVLDMPANTRKQRDWFKGIYTEHEIPHELYYLTVGDAGCLKQLKERQKQQPGRAHFDTEEVFKMVTSYFEPPSDSEGFNVVIVEPEIT